MLIGVIFALAAGMLWGSVFVVPLLLPEYPPLLQSLGRYLAFGFVALPVAWFGHAELRRLCRADWIDALKLTAVGNILYYLCLAGAIQLAGGPLPTMIIGTLPVAITVWSNLVNHQRDGHFPWAKLLPPTAIVLIGIGCVNQAELASLSAAQTATRVHYWTGAALAVGAVLCWTWYAVQNARWLRQHPDRNPYAWATAQGLVSLSLTLFGYAAVWLWYAAAGNLFVMPFGPRPEFFIVTMLAIGLFASWIGTICWNQASQRLPTALVGQLIVFETLAALIYAYLLRRQ